MDEVADRPRSKGGRVIADHIATTRTGKPSPSLNTGEVRI